MKHKVIDDLLKAGYEAYLVGGCVRDSLLNRQIHDLDVTTNATPEEIKRVFSEYRIIEMGIKHGTVGVVMDHRVIEITTYREDGDYLDFRRPESIRFAKSLREDLKRRDFTMNALAYNEYEGIIDVVNGQQDLKNRLIRCVGDASVRFTQDALRMIRALRFQSQLNFEIEAQTHQALMSLYPLMAHLSRERITQEFELLLMGDYVDRVLSSYLPVIEFIVRQPIDTSSLQNCPKVLEVRLAKLLSTCDFGFLSLEKKRLEMVRFLMENRDLSLGESTRDLLRLLSNHGLSKVRMLAQFQNVSIDQRLSEIEDRQLIYQVSDLKIDGNQLIKMGYQQGPQIKVLLNLILNAVIEGALENDLSQIQEWLINQ